MNAQVHDETTAQWVMPFEFQRVESVLAMIVSLMEGLLGAGTGTLLWMLGLRLSLWSAPHRLP
ncbi:hypothetical protein ACYJW8_06215 [Frateuria aurantia]